MARKMIGELPVRKCRLVGVYLTPDVERVVSQRARKHGVGLGRVVAQILEQHVADGRVPPAATAAPAPGQGARP